MKGDPFFDFQLGISFMKVTGIGACVCGVQDCTEDSGASWKQVNRDHCCVVSMGLCSS